MKRKYLLVDAKDIVIMKGTYKVNSSVLFDTKNIPKEYQKIILGLCINSIFKTGDAQEVFTGTPFDLTGFKIEEDNSKKIINGIDIVGLDLHIRTPLEKLNNNEVIEFLKELKIRNYLSDYMSAIETLFLCKYKFDIKTVENKILKLKR